MGTVVFSRRDNVLSDNEHPLLGAAGGGGTDKGRKSLGNISRVLNSGGGICCFFESLPAAEAAVADIKPPQIRLIICTHAEVPSSPPTTHHHLFFLPLSLSPAHTALLGMSVSLPPPPIPPPSYKQQGISPLLPISSLPSSGFWPAGIRLSVRLSIRTPLPPDIPRFYLVPRREGL